MLRYSVGVVLYSTPFILRAYSELSVTFEKPGMQAFKLTKLEGVFSLSSSSDILSNTPSSLSFTWVCVYCPFFLSRQTPYTHSLTFTPDRQIQKAEKKTQDIKRDFWKFFQSSKKRFLLCSLRLLLFLENDEKKKERENFFSVLPN